MAGLGIQGNLFSPLTSHSRTGYVTQSRLARLRYRRQGNASSFSLVMFGQIFAPYGRPSSQISRTFPDRHLN